MRVSTGDFTIARLKLLSVSGAVLTAIVREVSVYANFPVIKRVQSIQSITMLPGLTMGH